MRRRGLSNPRENKVRTDAALQNGGNPPKINIFGPLQRNAAIPISNTSPQERTDRRRKFSPPHSHGFFETLDSVDARSLSKTNPKNEKQNRSRGEVEFFYLPTTGEVIRPESVRFDPVKLQSEVQPCAA
jgi:hypothetical protein